MIADALKLGAMKLALDKLPKAIEDVKREKGELPRDVETHEVVGKLKHEMRKNIGPAVDLLWAGDFDEKLAAIVSLAVD